MKSNRIAPGRLSAALQAYIKFRPLLAQHPPHRSECPYFWIALRTRMPMRTPFCITLLLSLKSVVLLPRKALWCVWLINSVLSIDLAKISASFSVPHVLLCRLLLPYGGVALGAFGEICGYCCSRCHGSHGEACITSCTRRVEGSGRHHARPTSRNLRLHGWDKKYPTWSQKNYKRCKKGLDVVLAHTSSRGGYQWARQQHQRYVLVKQGVCIRIKRPTWPKFRPAGVSRN